jgi:formate hydrogenlyase subunit 3/multisubunit Na+/H+ antiporter MnhD subunit
MRVHGADVALYASIVLVLIAGDAVLFLLAWEVMSILCYLLVVWGRNLENGQFRRGYLLLAMGEAGTLAAALGFLLLGVNAVRWIFQNALKSNAAGSGHGRALDGLSAFVFRFRREGRPGAGEFLAAGRLHVARRARLSPCWRARL